MIEWILLAAGAGAGGLVIRRLVTRRKPRETLPLGHLATAAGEVVTVRGKVSASPTLSPVTWHPCAAWWCWVERQGSSQGWEALGAAAHGNFAIRDRSGTLQLEASECRMTHPSSAELVMPQDQWPTEGSSEFHDALRALCQAAGVPRPEAEAVLRVRESLLPVGVSVEARGLIVLEPGEQPVGYRGESSELPVLCAPPGSLIELTAR